jgi:hypothetical protein
VEEVGEGATQYGKEKYKIGRHGIPQRKMRLSEKAN